MKRMDIITKAIKIAEDDDTIEVDEDALLKALNEKIQELSSLEKR